MSDTNTTEDQVSTGNRLRITDTLQQRCHQRRRAGPRPRLHRGRNAYPAAQGREGDDVHRGLRSLAAAAAILRIPGQACAARAPS